MTQLKNQVVLERRIPRSVASIVARLTQDEPITVTRNELNKYLDETGSPRQIESVLRELIALGWLSSTPRHGVWAFITPGEIESKDPYLGLRAWKASDPSAVFALAGETVAWHLGFIARQYNGPTAIWIPTGTIVPRGLRRHLTTITLGWNAAKAASVGPERKWLLQRKLDLTRWSNGIPAFGPEALLVQLGTRPASFHPWGDLAPNLNLLATSCELTRLLDLLDGQKTTAYQRVAYFLSIGGNAATSHRVLTARPTKPLSHIILGNGQHSSERRGDLGVSPKGNASEPRGDLGVSPKGDSTFSATYQITDRLVAPFLAQFAKA